MKKFQSSKLMDGYSTCYRNHSATDQTQQLHGCDIKFRMHFEGELDHRNWVADFGWMKRSKQTISGMSVKDYFSYLFDHTCLIQNDDPLRETFEDMNRKGTIQLRLMDSTTKEGIEKYLFSTIQTLITDETEGRVNLVKLEVTNY